MHPLISNILLTGHPGCGKTTLVRRVVDGLSVPTRGFYTEEVRGTTGRRTGFDVVMTDGRRGSLARMDSTGPRVGRYGVRLDFLENIALPYLAEHKDTVIIIDEVGKMECFSDHFKHIRVHLHDSAFAWYDLRLSGQYSENQGPGFIHWTLNKHYTQEGGRKGVLNVPIIGPLGGQGGFFCAKPSGLFFYAILLKS